MRDDLGVGVAREAHAAPFELAAQLGVVLDDPVVNHGDVPRDVGVGVRFARPPVRGPARVTDPRGAAEGVLAERGVEVAELPDGANDLDASARVDREARRVVAAVFEATEPLDEQRGALLRADVANDSAHDRESP